MAQSAEDAEKWLSADAQVVAELQNFSQHFGSSRARFIARALEDKVKSYQPAEVNSQAKKVRELHRFSVQHFRNLDHFEINIDHIDGDTAQAVVLSGPNGTGKSSLAEAIALAAFKTSPRFYEYVADIKNVFRPSAAKYMGEYLTNLDHVGKTPSFIWNDEAESQFVLEAGEDSGREFYGVVLNQEDSSEFTKMSHEELAARVLRGYSDLADSLVAWLTQEESQAKEIKQEFTRRNGLNGAIKLSSTAYNGLAQGLLEKQLQRPSPEFLDWVRFLGRMPDGNGKCAVKLLDDWANQQANVAGRLAGTIAKLQEKGASEEQQVQEIQSKLEEFDALARSSFDFRKRLEGLVSVLREQIDSATGQMDAWGAWLKSRSSKQSESNADILALRVEIDRLSQERASVERDGKTFRNRLDLLDQSQLFLSNHWTVHHPNTCPICDSDVSDRKGIEAVVLALQQEVNIAVQTLRVRYVEIQNRQKELDGKLQASGMSICPVAFDDQARLKEWLTPFLPKDVLLEDWLIDPQHREQLKGDLRRMRAIPEAPKPHADSKLESVRLAKAFISLAQEADKALEDPQAIDEVKKAFEQRLEKVLRDHLPTTLGRVWQEITLALTSASWLQPNHRPTLKIDKRGKALSVQVGETGRLVRYLCNAAERHLSGLAWFFTYYLAKRRFEEGWMLLDDPAQEMDQPSFRELIRFVETLLRLQRRTKRSFSMILCFHQEERALDAARGTDGKIYMLGWDQSQQDRNEAPSIKKVILLAPGFYPLTPDGVFKTA